MCARARVYVCTKREICVICMICIIELISNFCDKVHINTFLKTAHIRHLHIHDIQIRKGSILINEQI